MLSLPKHLLPHTTFHYFVAEVLFIFLKNQVEIGFASVYCYFIWYVFPPLPRSYLGRQKKVLTAVWPETFWNSRLYRIFIEMHKQKIKP